MKSLLQILVTTLFLICSNLIFAQEKASKINCTNSDCHAEMLTKKFVHASLQDDCLVCHQKTNGEHPNRDGNEFVLANKGKNLCEQCHEIEASKEVVHGPYISGDCTMCHSPHSSNAKSILRSENQKEICSECHDLEANGHNYFHGPFISNQCSSCHFSHESNYENLLVNKDPELCLQCHIGKEEDMNLPVVHAAFNEGCLDCHFAHSSEVSNMLVAKGSELCLECHSDFQDEYTSAKIVHEPASKEGECVSCHSPHAGELENLLVNIQPELCFNCHSENIYNKEKYIDIFGRLSKEFVHAPVFEKPCTECHKPHVSDSYHLLAAAFPKGNYTKPNIENYSMCFQCHDSDRITNKTSTETNFRDGNKNLHTIHVMKKKSISCQSCHDMHGADNQHIIGNVVYFGNWEMPINYKVTPIGGSCLPGCHQELSYTRE